MYSVSDDIRKVPIFICPSIDGVSEWHSIHTEIFRVVFLDGLCKILSVSHNSDLHKKIVLHHFFYCSKITFVTSLLKNIPLFCVYVMSVIVKTLNGAWAFSYVILFLAVAYYCIQMASIIYRSDSFSAKWQEQRFARDTKKEMHFYAINLMQIAFQFCVLPHSPPISVAKKNFSEAFESPKCPKCFFVAKKQMNKIRVWMSAFGSL